MMKTIVTVLVALTMFGAAAPASAVTLGPVFNEQQVGR